ncbi:glyoxalase/bleomycin resistance/dioxygenase family protein [Kribbella sp. NBC_01245]|uniref:VOC family protein n=1 Tax=Kribbella sp. NBC_01245 TaxID=2903578 RepID=UPI002E2BC4B8|nr:VOC family protein [Kribbella sp. NBC_01245]
MSQVTQASSPFIGIDPVVLDCQDPRELAGFYSALLGQEVDPNGDDDWQSLAEPGLSLCFRRVEGAVPPPWPVSRPHLDLIVEDFASGHATVARLGAVPLDPVEPPPAEGDRRQRVYADPAGHVFSLWLD